MKKLLILLLATLLILGSLVGGIACNNTDNGVISANIKSLMEKTPKDVSNFFSIDIETLRNDDDLEALLEGYENFLGIMLVEIDIDIDIEDIDCSAMYGNSQLLYGDFNLDDIRDELDTLNFNDSEYNNVEIWERADGGIWVALIENLIIVGSEDSVKGCIGVIEEGEASMLDDSSCKEIVDRLPGGYMVTYNTYQEFPDQEAFGMSIQKKDDDTLKMTAIFKFKGGYAAYDAMDEIEDDLAGENDFSNINVHQIGEFVIVTVEIDIDVVLVADQDGDQDEDARTERDNVQLAVVEAMASIPVGVLDAGGTIDRSACTVTYNGGTPLPVGDMLTGRLESLTYSYSVETDGEVNATSGPLAE